MKIVHVIPYMHPAAGGPPVVVDRLSQELAALGHEVRVLTTDQFSQGDTAWQAAKRAYALEVFPVGARNYGYSAGFASAITAAVAGADVVQIHCLWTYASVAAARACHQAGVPWLVMPHGMLDPNSVARGWLKKQLYGRLVEWPWLRRAWGMCYTHPEEERLARQTCRGLPRGHIVELGADTPPDIPREQMRAAFRVRYPQLQNRFTLLFLGRLHPKKGLDLLIPAMKNVLIEHPDVHLLLVGPGDDAYVGSIRQEIARQDLSKSVTLTGSLYGTEKWEAMAAADLFVLPSYQENFALAGVDAIRGGLPVLLSRRVNLWDDIEQSGAGRACDPTVASVSKELSACIRDRAWRTAAVPAGQQLLTRRFNWAVTARHVADLFAAAARERRS